MCNFPKLIYKAGKYQIVNCGVCSACRKKDVMQWSMRAVHEFYAHKEKDPENEGCFLTLTYNPENLPKDLSLHPEHMKLFWNALRKALTRRYMPCQVSVIYNPRTGKFTHKKRYPFPFPLRYMDCGEYGNSESDPSLYLKEVGRPHYHAVIFNWRPDDLFEIPFHKGLFRSDLIEKLWTRGQSSVGDCNEETCKYVAGYVMKKVKGKKAQTGFYFNRNLCPEYSHRSQGLGKDYLKYIGEQVKALGYIPFHNKKGEIKKASIPRYYEGYLYQTDAEKEKRKNVKIKYLEDAHKRFEDSLDINDYTRFVVNCRKEGCTPLSFSSWVCLKDRERCIEREKRAKLKEKEFRKNGPEEKF